MKTVRSVEMMLSPKKKAETQKKELSKEISKESQILDSKTGKYKKKFRNSYLQVLEEMAKVCVHDLEDEHAQVVARHNIIDAIAAVRGTLAAVKSIGPDFGDGYKWSGGSLAPDGRVFFAPHASDHVN
jgi:uncharacterized protein with gpF-like domain